ncbi:exported protein of unknown function [Nitrospira japonica]|uniref:DUF4136 domain-containing protein n=1 Tax=Nitrospira japonica TaxID=1325564 RepID=A0A1W1IAK1_9BACT|nr:DUF4136 domain-containing protein [Nitrospira japonica]SLM50077.1 exported protein of unknown function [Nitrospira japonica]
MKDVLRVSLLLCGLLLTAGCAQTVVVDASGTTKSGAVPPHVTYVVLPTAEVEKDQAFPAYAALVAGKMDDLGYKKTSEKTAQLGVFLAYATHEGASAAPAKSGNAGANMGGMGPGSPGGSGYGMSSGPSQDTSGQRTYTNQLVVVVVDLQKSSNTGPVVELWRGETTNTSRSKNFEQVAPLMVDAAFQHFGESTPSAVRHQFTLEDGKKPQEMKNK